MPYTALEFDTDAAEPWFDALLDAGALAVDAADAHAGTPDETPLFGEPGAPGATPWRCSRLTALFVDDAAAEAALVLAARSLGRPVPACRRTRVADQDWVRATQAQFGPITIGGRLAIVPSWCDPPEGAIAIRLDPGLAFGTGSHPTTSLCLEWLLAFVTRGSTVLDYGCGSGVLAIAAMRLGAREAVGVDLDPQAIRASRDNARANAVAATFVLPDGLAAGVPFDVVVANILANPLILLAPALAARVRPGGRLALSGILAAQADEVIAAYAPWFTLRAWRGAEGWVLLAGERAAAAG